MPPRPLVDGTGAKIHILDPLAEMLQNQDYRIHGMDLDVLKLNIADHTATDDKATSEASDTEDQRLIKIHQRSKD